MGLQREKGKERLLALINRETQGRERDQSAEHGTLTPEVRIKEETQGEGEEAGNLRKVIRACVASERQTTQEGRAPVKPSAGSRAKRGVGWGGSPWVFLQSKKPDVWFENSCQGN